MNRLVLTLTIFLAIVSSSCADVVTVNFDGVVASAGGTLFSGDTFAASGVTFTSGSIPDVVAVGDIVSLSGPLNQIMIVADAPNISPPNFAIGAQVFGPANDVLMSFVTPVTSVQLTTDDAFPETSADVVRLLALSWTGVPFQYQVLAITEGLDNAIAPPDNLLSVGLGGQHFSFALFQVTTEAEGFDDLTFTTAPIPEPGSLLLCLLGAGAALLVRRKFAATMIEPVATMQTQARLKPKTYC